LVGGSDAEAIVGWGANADISPRFLVENRQIKMLVCKATRDLLLVIPGEGRGALQQRSWSIQLNMLCAAHKTYVERFARCIETGLTSSAVVKRLGLRRNDEQNVGRYQRLHPNLRH
jgi:hypothetical protein